jgi:hypothetical protein
MARGSWRPAITGLTEGPTAGRIMNKRSPEYREESVEGDGPKRARLPNTHSLHPVPCLCSSSLPGRGEVTASDRRSALQVLSVTAG